MAVGCFRQLHSQAIADAIQSSPTSLKAVLLKNKDVAIQEVYDIEPSPKNRSFETYYRKVMEVAKDFETNKSEYFAKRLVDITIYVFEKYCPIEPDSCDPKGLLKEAAVIYDGYDTDPDYSKVTDYFFEDKHKKYEHLYNDQKMLQFYNKLVNEILDLWVAIWKDAGRDIAGTPEKYTMLRGSNSNNVTVILSADDLRKFGDYCLSINDPNQAIIAFNGIIQKNKNDIDAVYNLAFAQYTIKNYRNSLENFRTAGDYKDSLYYHGVLAEYFAKKQTSIKDQIPLYHESFQSLNSYFYSKKRFASDAYEKGKSVGKILIELQGKALVGRLDDINNDFEKTSRNYNSNYIALATYNNYLAEMEKKIKKLEYEINNEYAIVIDSFNKQYDDRSSGIDFISMLNNIKTKLQIEQKSVISTQKTIQKEMQRQSEIEMRKNEYKQMVPK